MEKTMKARVQHKHDIEANWLKATNFTPLASEIIVYDPDENYDYPRIKIGDGETNINALPFVTKDYAKISDIPTKPEDIGALPDSTVIPTVPTKISAFENDKGYLTQHQSLDAYAKTADLGALATKDSLTASDVGALPDTTKIPSTLADLTADSTHRTVTDTEKNTWNAKANASDIPTKVSDLTNDKGYITSYTETDPTVPAWAKAATKPSYTASEVGALPSTTKIPGALSDLSEDTTHRVVTDAEKETWNAKSNFSGSYNDLTNKPTIPSIAGLASTTYVDDAVKNKVDKDGNKVLSTNDYTTAEKNKLAGIAAGAEVNVNADWNATSGDAQILNKPTLGSMAAKSSVAKSDLASGVQTSLGKADSALQPGDISDWAKQPSKPSYTKSEIGLGNVDNVKQYSASNPPPYPVTSVNGKTGAVTVTVPTVPTKVSAFTNDAGYLTEHQDISGKVDVNTAQTFTEEQKAQARANIGAQAELTEADKEDIVQQVITALGTPVFGRVDENKNITLTVGTLADGVYTLWLEDENGKTTKLCNYDTSPGYINWIKRSVEADDTPYNGGQGWKTDTRLSSSGAESTSGAAAMEVTGFIPFKRGDIIRFSGITMNANSANVSRCYFIQYDENKTMLKAWIVSGFSTDISAGRVLVDADGNILQINTGDMVDESVSGATTPIYTNAAYFRISADEINDDSIITINQKIPEDDSMGDSGSIELTWADGVKLNKATGVEESEDGYAASQHIELVDGYTYTFAQDAVYGGVSICYYDANGTGLGYELLWDGVAEVKTKTLTPIVGAVTFRVRLYYGLNINLEEVKNGYLLTYEKTNASAYTNLFDPATATINTRMSGSTSVPKTEDGYVMTAQIMLPYSVTVPNAYIEDAPYIAVPASMWKNSANIFWWDNTDSGAFASVESVEVTQSGDWIKIPAYNSWTNTVTATKIIVSLCVSAAAITESDIQDIKIYFNECPGEEEPAYTNLANPKDSNWIEGKRFNSSKQLVDWEDSATGRKGVITNYIDVSACKEYIHVKGIDLLQGNSRYYKYSEVGGELQEGTNIGTNGHTTTAAYDSDVTLIPASDILTAKIWRLGGLLTGTSDDVIITIDEEIK